MTSCDGKDKAGDQPAPDKIKVAELRAALQERLLDTKGMKPVLVERIQEARVAQEAGGRCRAAL